MGMTRTSWMSITRLTFSIPLAWHACEEGCQPRQRWHGTSMVRMHACMHRHGMQTLPVRPPVTIQYEAWQQCAAAVAYACTCTATHAGAAWPASKAARSSRWGVASYQERKTWAHCSSRCGPAFYARGAGAPSSGWGRVGGLWFQAARAAVDADADADAFIRVGVDGPVPYTRAMAESTPCCIFIERQAWQAAQHTARCKLFLPIYLQPTAICLQPTPDSKQTTVRPRVGPLSRPWLVEPSQRDFSTYIVRKSLPPSSHRT